MIPAIEALYEIFFNEYNVKITMTVNRIIFEFREGFTVEYDTSGMGFYEGTLERAMVFTLQHVSQRQAAVFKGNMETLLNPKTRTTL